MDRKEVIAAETEDRRQKKWPVIIRYVANISPARPNPDVNSAHPGTGLFHYIAEEETMQIWRY